MRNVANKPKHAAVPHLTRFNSLARELAVIKKIDIRLFRQNEKVKIVCLTKFGEANIALTDKLY